MAINPNYTYFEISLKGEIFKYLAKSVLQTRTEIYSYCIACEIPIKYYDQIISYKTQNMADPIDKDVKIVEC